MKNLLILVLSVACFLAGSAQQKIYVSLTGNDNSPGDFTHPVKTLNKALMLAALHPRKDVVIEMHGGNYELEKTVFIRAATPGFNSLTIKPYNHQKVAFTGSKQIYPRWNPYQDGIMQASVNLEDSPDQLFLNGSVLPMARYPNFDSTARVFNGTAPDAISDVRVARWKNPAGGFIHALHQGEWGAFHYRITGKDAAGKLMYEGGWQNNRPAPMHPEHRFVENIFEELDAPGEWFYDKATSTLFLYPPKGTNLTKAVVAVSTLTDLIHIIGDQHQPANRVTISDISFTQTARSFMQVKEPLLRSDWTIYRGGAILADGTGHLEVKGCEFYGLGGNAVFLSNYNKDAVISNNHIHDIGASAIAFVGNPAAVRSPAFQYDSFVQWGQMNFTPGPAGEDYPQYCLASGNLVHNIGTIEKQVAGVEIDMAAHITVRHNSIYHVPRSGINIGDGCWGGHVLEFNDVFNTVLETGDHGAFNSWGRDRYWRSDRDLIDSIVAAMPGIELLDAINRVTIRNNRFECDHGWDIDLDDGSSNYQIYNNICLNGGLKLREGFHRTVTNNILVNNSFHPHVWLRNSGDVFTHNIVSAPYAPILMNNWGKQIDSNFFLTSAGLAEATALGIDQRSIWGDPQFVDANRGDYHVASRSPALTVGFTNFDMDFGVVSPALKQIAERPANRPLYHQLASSGTVVDWLGARFKNIETPGERSAAGLHNNKGAMLLSLPPQSLAAKSGLKKGDVIVELNKQPVDKIGELLQIYQTTRWMGAVECVIIRNQAQQSITLSFK